MRYSEIWHWEHPQHKLKLETQESPFRCDGCKEVGIGSRYRCKSQRCDYDLHLHCALPDPGAPLFHPFYRKCSFEFMAEAPGGSGARYCNACGRDVKGYVYHCRWCGYDLHPCCAKLPMVLEDDDGETKLYLQRKVRSACDRCGRKGKLGSWSYRSACKTYNVHVACVRDMLVENCHVGIGKGIMMVQRHKNKGWSCSWKSNKSCEIAAFALQIVLSALLGDPTALIASLISTA